MGLSSFIDKIEQEAKQKSNIVPLFKKYFYKLWLDNVLIQ